MNKIEGYFFLLMKIVISIGKHTKKAFVNLITPDGNPINNTAELKLPNSVQLVVSFLKRV